MFKEYRWLQKGTFNSTSATINRKTLSNCKKRSDGLLHEI